MFEKFKWHVWKSPTNRWYVRKLGLFGWKYVSHRFYIWKDVTDVTRYCSCNTEHEAKHLFNKIIL